MKACLTIVNVGLLPCFAVAATGSPNPFQAFQGLQIIERKTETFLLVLDLDNGLCLTSRRSLDSSVEGRPCDPADWSQRWYMRERAIVNSEYGGCLAPDRRKNVVVRTCNGGRKQEWDLNYLRDHLLGEKHWVRHLQNMKCMRFHPKHYVYIDTCADVPESQFLKLTEWPYSRSKTKDVASSCLDRKCPECSMCSCRFPECLESSDILVNLVFMVPVLLVICGALGWIWKANKGDKPTGLKQQVPSESPHGQAREKKLDTMDATILHNIYSIVTEIAAAIDGQRGSDSSSDCTVGSWTHVTSGQPCCFLPDTYFKVVTDDGEICEKPAKMLFKGTRVIAADGTEIEVLHPPEQHQVDAVIKLQVGSAFLVVSPDHRMLIPGKETIQAKELEEGSEVFLDGTEAKAKLTSVEWNLVPTMVVKIAFKPDIPVAAAASAFMWAKARATSRESAVEPAPGHHKVEMLWPSQILNLLWPHSAINSNVVKPPNSILQCSVAMVWWLSSLKSKCLQCRGHWKRPDLAQVAECVSAKLVRDTTMSPHSFYPATLIESAVSARLLVKMDICDFGIFYRKTTNTCHWQVVERWVNLRAISRLGRATACAQRHPCCLPGSVLRGERCVATQYRNSWKMVFKHNII